MATGAVRRLFYVPGDTIHSSIKSKAPLGYKIGGKLTGNKPQMK
jgi:hypothetical protein